MCLAAGAYVVFLLLEDVIVGYYSTDAASQDPNLNISKIKAAYDVYQKDMARSLSKVNQSNGEPKVHYFLSFSPKTSDKHRKDSQGERVTRKQYQFMNMLWRNTRMSVKDNNIYAKTPHSENNINMVTLKRFKKENPTILTFPTLPLKTTTSSNIEFYYLDDTNDHEKVDACLEPNCQENHNKIVESKAKLALHPSFLVFHLKGTAKPQYVKSTTLRLNESLFVNEQAVISDILLNKPRQVTRVKENQKSYVKGIINLPTKKYFIDHAPLAQTMKSLVTLRNLTDYAGNNTSTTDKEVTESTTLNDKIKFFEMYDQNTKASNLKKIGTSKMTNVEEKRNKNQKKILLEDVDQGSYDHRQAKHEKKHITESYRKLEKVNQKIRDYVADGTIKSQTNGTSHVSNAFLKNHAQSDNKIVWPFVNKTARWSDYPFAAVYIYELSQVHCDAAGITAHWLVASGSCMSRVSKSPDGEGRSAFVAYCGEQWWQPERVAYVKYSIVHPWYHHRDKTRRHLYNIGLIQVVNSMTSACSSWAPAHLMSHQFVAEPEGSEATAVGWGLDRYDTRYSATELPKIPLMLYKGHVYFDSCPGNVGYSKAKRLDEGGNIRNVHCLSLPPYSDEDTDPVHGSLLLVGEKLIALYLQARVPRPVITRAAPGRRYLCRGLVRGNAPRQIYLLLARRATLRAVGQGLYTLALREEERRPRGLQSAQYTGIWHLIPWIMEVAREPEEVIFEI